MPELDNEEKAELERLGFGLGCKLPFFGKLDKLLPKEVEEEKEEEQADEVKEKDPEDENNGEEKEEKEKNATPKIKVEKIKPRKFKLLESHRVSNQI